MAPTTPTCLCGAPYVGQDPDTGAARCAECLQVEISHWRGRVEKLATELRNADAGLVERAVRNAHEVGRPRWATVRQTFAIGSTRASALCRRFGLDPDDVL